MNEAIIGGAIAAVIGTLAYGGVALWQERRRERAQQLAIVEALIIETAENLVTLKNTTTSELWWLASFVLDAYHTYKGQFFFLPEAVSIQLASAVGNMRGLNVIIEDYRLRVGLGRTAGKKGMPPAKELIEQLEFMNNELRKWRWENTLSLRFRIHRKLQNFISKNCQNSKLNHS